MNADEIKMRPVAVEGDSKRGSSAPGLPLPADTIEGRISNVPDAQRKTKRKYKKRPKEPVHMFPIQPGIVKVVTKPKSFINHRYY